MISKCICFAGLIVLLCWASLEGQTSSFPFIEKFDSVVPPRLPEGWTTTSNKSLSGDFTTSTSNSFSGPNAVVSTDAKVAQCLTSPSINFEGKIPASMEFHERRTSSHNSGLLIQALVNGDTTTVIPVGDTLRNTGATGYITRTLPLPASLADKHDVRFRWRVTGDGTGATGTVRIDDVVVTVQKQRDLAITSLSPERTVVRSGENVGVHVGVSNKALGGTFQFSLQMFDDANADSFVTADEKIAEQSISVTISAAESTTFTLTYPAIPPGPHRLIVKLVLQGDEDSTNNTSATAIVAGYSRRSVVINEIMYAPSAGPEWIECINASADTVSLSQWKVGDNTSSRAAITSAPVAISPRQFFIIAKDTSIFASFPAIDVPVIKCSFPALNNDGDAVVIVDATGYTIDSVAYLASWGGAGGKSLERIDTAESSTSPSNWGSSRNPSGATPGFVNSLTKKNYDVSVDRIYLSKAAPCVGEPFRISVLLKNIGRRTLSGYSVSFSRIGNYESEPPERYGQIPLRPLSPSDSAAVTELMNVSDQGVHRVVVTVHATGDEDTTNNSAAVSFTVGVKPHSVVVNEIMYAPPGDMPEWVEFYNTGSEAVDLNGWKISDSKVKLKGLINAPPILQPGAYFLVAADSTLGNYFSITTPVSVSSFGALNNSTPDAVVLYDNRGVTMDSVWYKPSWGGTNGRSLERVDFLSSSVDSANWRSSDPTPGFENSVAKKNVDLEAAGITGVPIVNGIRLSASIHNVGRWAVSPFIVEFFHDANRDSIASAGELLKSVQGPALGPGDSIVVQYPWQTTSKGKIPIICRVILEGDQRLSNNEILGWTANSFTQRSAVINEIMYDPLPGRSEFIELFNRSSDTLDLQGWKIMDALSSSGSRNIFGFTNQPALLPPGAYFVVGADSNIIAQFSDVASMPASRIMVTNKDLSLNNSGDDVILLDLTDACIDSVRYSPDWNNPALKASTSGKSLERINPSLSSNDKRNWSTSVSSSGATPGERNSVYTVTLPSTAGMRLSPNPFSPDNDGFEDLLAINYSLPSTTSMIRVRCFDVQGRLVRTLANNEAAASSGTVLWDGLDDNHRHVRIGMYIILFEAFDAHGGSLSTMKDVAVVARKL
jgi:Lamin Tail Domain